MSSTQSSFSQVKPRGKFFLAVPNANGGTTGITEEIFTYALLNYPNVSHNGNIISANTVGELQGFYDVLDSFAIAVDTGSLLKDLGKEIIFSLRNGNIVAKWSLVQFVNGPKTEGVPPLYKSDDTLYVLTSQSATGVIRPAIVARVG